MSKQICATVALTLLACACWQAAIAAEQILEFKLVVKLIDPKTLEAPNVEGQVVLLSKAHGVAFFKGKLGGGGLNLFADTSAQAGINREGQLENLVQRPFLE